MSDIFELLKELDISYVEVSGFKDKHFMRINLDIEDLEKLNVHYYQYLLNLMYQSKIKNRILEKALDKACEELEKLDESHAYECNKQIIEKKGSSTITFGYQTKGEWKEYLLKEVREDENN